MNQQRSQITDGPGSTIGHLEKLRESELEMVKSWFRAGTHVLELGGGSGYQASRIASWGCEVASIDIRGRLAAPILYYPVRDYDGRRIPFSDGTFDLVFSSNVLEHIPDLPSMLTEIRRVLKSDGVAIHILPTPAWRFWTSLSYYGYILKRFADGPKNTGAGVSTVPDVSAQINKFGIGRILRRAIFAGPHGEYPNALAELWYFSRKRWLGVFASERFVLATDYPTNLFYTGYCLFPSLRTSTRRRLSHFFGSACRVFVMRRDRAG